MKVPDPPEPLPEMSVTEKYDPSAKYFDEKTVDGVSFEFRVTGSETKRVEVSAPLEREHGRILWTGVVWAREFGIPGVNRETIRASDKNVRFPKYRLGGLYRRAGFEYFAEEVRES